MWPEMEDKIKALLLTNDGALFKHPALSAKPPPADSVPATCYFIDITKLHASAHGREMFKTLRGVLQV